MAQAHIALFLVALIYGGNFIIAKDVMGQAYLEPLGFILLRVVTGLLLFWMVQSLFIRENINRKDLFLLAVCGFFGVAVNQMFFFSGLNLTSPINASLIMTTTPVLVLLASALILKEAITLLKLSGVALGALGAILLILYGKTIDLSGKAWLGNLLVFINAFSYGVYLVLVKPLMKKYHPITVIKWVFFFGLLFVTPFGFRQLWNTPWDSFTTNAWLGVLYVLIFTTFFTYLLNAYALARVNPSVVSIYIYLQPLLAALLALMLGKDMMSPVKWTAGILIFTGVYLVSMPFSARKMRRTKGREETPAP